MSDLRENLARELTTARDRTLLLTDQDEPELTRQHSPLMSPLVWDLAHIGQQEDLWLLRHGDADRPGLLPPAVEVLYDAFSQPRAVRNRLPLLPPVEARAFCGEVRGRVLDRLDTLGDADDPFDFAMVVSHEQQHDETMLQALQLRSGPPLLGVGTPLPPGRPGLAGTSVLVPGGPFVLGVDAADEPFSLDNERPAHWVDVPAFRIGRVPVTNAEYAGFVADGGYDRPRWWSARGWAHRQETGLERPQFWGPDGTRTRSPGRPPAGATRDLVRGRGVRGVGGRAAAHRGGVGEGGGLGPVDRAAAALPMGVDRARPGRRQPRRGGPAARAGGCLSCGGVRLRGRAPDG
jgi:gamma-glutamyl hercynylcysteine S-oxide synthase